MAERDEMDTTETEEVSEYELKSPDVVTKYKTCSEIVNKVLGTLIKEAVAGKKVIDLCVMGDKMMNEQINAVYNKTKIDKGVAFPTCISLNNCVGNYSPLVDDNDQTILNEGDVAKIDLGVQIDGYISVAAHTVIVGGGAGGGGGGGGTTGATPAQGNPGGPTSGRKGDVICAAWQAAEAAHRLVRPGRKNTEVTEAINKIAEIFKCNLVEGVLSHQMKRFVIDGNKSIISKPSLDHKVEEFEFEENQVYAIDIVVSTGEGKPKELETKTTVFKRAVEQSYLLKMKASREVFNQVNKSFPTFPFSLRALEDEKRAKLGITEMLKHDLVHPYPVLYEKQGEYVAQFKFTLLVLPSGTNRENLFTPPFVSSEFKIEDPAIKAILALPTKRGKKKKKKTEKEGGADDKMDTTEQ